MTTTEFLTAVYALAAEGRVPVATDVVVDCIDQLLLAGRLADCDGLLQAVDLSRLPSSVRRSFLMMTACVKDQLPSRPGLYRRALELLTAERGEETAKRVLRTLA